MAMHVNFKNKNFSCKSEAESELTVTLTHCM